MRCSRRNGEGWQCPKEAVEGRKLCEEHVQAKRAWIAEKKRGGFRCSRCYSRPPMGKGSICEFCHAYSRERKMPHIPHDPAMHAKMIRMTTLPESRCAVTGLSNHELRKVGDQLSVDRIDSAVGYVQGNMRLLTMSLNRAKGVQDAVPEGAIQRLLRRLERVRASRLTSSRGRSTRARRRRRILEGECPPLAKEGGGNGLGERNV